jgi:hypothetical protein
MSYEIMEFFMNMKHNISLTLLLLFLFGCAEQRQEGFHANACISLGHAFIRAVSKIQSSQSKEGHWKTSHTTDTVFVNSQQEVNVWTPIMMVDLLNPVADETGLRDALERARGYLRDQIEPTGLVRYLGKGSKLVPDSDDTALIWLVAPPNDATLVIDRVLGVLRQYRNEEGLYRMWLSRPGHPGDIPFLPNIVDMGAQPHVYLWLKKYAPKTADSLCQAMNNHIADPRKWPFYGRTPWIYILREIDLHKAGCALKRPETILRSYVAGQEAYVKLIQLMQDLILGENHSDLRSEIFQVLMQLAEDNFSLVEQTPLLMYHNNQFAAPIIIYYWSKELAYALWLRLYVEASRKFENWSIPQK